ncbi:MAG: glycosyltransferase family 4 protein [Paludibacter sp.]|jgi:glycosyltransferase involved in cell wall biosynthesis|nr:glycosyltransferase family 4 protein [Paludibacter sp.]
MKKKKVLIDLSSLEDLHCGLGQVSINYCKYFRDNYKRQTADYQLYLLVPKKFFGQFGNEVKYLSSTNWLRRHCRFLFPQFDVWHAIHQLSRFKPAYNHTKLILTIHDLNYLYEKHGKRRAQGQRRMQRKVNRADEIVCISQFACSEVERNLNLGNKRCRVILNGVENLSQNPVQKPKIDICEPFFFTLGVLKAKKNFHVLLDMMKLMPDKQLYIVGKGNDSYSQYLYQRIENENITNVKMLGIVTDEEKTWLFRNCEAFLFPSLFEGFGLPVVEAMLFGKAVFSSAETSLKEIGSTHAFFWKSFEPNEMKTLIDNNLADFYKSQEKIQAEIDYANSFSYKKHLQQYEELYSKYI